MSAEPADFVPPGGHRQAPWYRRASTYWVSSAKKEETRKKRLATLIADGAAGRLVGPLRRRGKSGG